MTVHLTFHDIESLDDVRYDDYLDLYQKSFPLNEQELVSRQNRILRAHMRGDRTANRMFVAISPEGETVGMARYELGTAASILWYLAVSPLARGGGLGSAIYAEIARRARSEAPGALALVYEVERRELAEDKTQAERRIRFYQKNGGLLLDGISYAQSVGWQPPVAMDLMIHPFQPMTAEAALAVCEAVFGDTVRRVDAPTLRGLG